jgi:hypothetical protein
MNICSRCHPIDLSVDRGVAEEVEVVVEFARVEAAVANQSPNAVDDVSSASAAGPLVRSRSFFVPRSTSIRRVSHDLWSTRAKLAVLRLSAPPLARHSVSSVGRSPAYGEQGRVPETAETSSAKGRKLTGHREQSSLGLAFAAICA